MEKYLMMSDVFKSKLFIDSDCDDVIVDGLSLTVLESFSGSDAAKFALHAINSHDELVEMNKELLEALEVIAASEEFHGDSFVCDFETLQRVARDSIAKAKGTA